MATADKHWGVTEFYSDPTREQLVALHSPNGIQKISLLFDRPAAPYLAEAYISLAQAWKNAGIEGQFKFVGSLPTEQEAQLLKPVCEHGVKIYFVTNSLPMDAEAKNLSALAATTKGCVQVDFALGRYPKYVDVLELKKMPGVPFSVTNDYLPAYTHVDNLNLLENPVALRVSRSIPTAYQIELLNALKRMTALQMELDIFPMPEQYALFAKLERKDDRRFLVRWTAGPPRAEDLAAWKRVGLSRLQIPQEILQSAGIEEQLRTLESEVIIETFSLKTQALGARGFDEAKRVALEPR